MLELFFTKIVPYLNLLIPLVLLASFVYVYWLTFRWIRAKLRHEKLQPKEAEQVGDHPRNADAVD